MRRVTTFSQIVRTCEEKKWKFADYFLHQEMEWRRRNGEDSSPETILEKMDINLRVMESSVKEGIKGVQSYSGLTGYDATRLNTYRSEKASLGQSIYLDAVVNAIAINEVNASMGLICATPTAGSCGVVPGILLAAREHLKLNRRQQLDFLITSGGCGLMIGNLASISGAEGGCQAEIGSASGMAAAALAEAAGGSPRASSNALAIAIKGLLGLVCDPVASLVEVPCIKRNATGVVNAITAAEMALAGMLSRIPTDEVISAMYSVGQLMPSALRETALGGLAQTPTARRYTRELKQTGKITWQDSKKLPSSE
jgi:L-serine dehydratase